MRPDGLHSSCHKQTILFAIYPEIFVPQVGL